MTYVTAWPTLSSLRTTPVDRAPVGRQRSSMLMPQRSIQARVLERLDVTLATTVSIKTMQWVATPRGELPVSCTLEGHGKRIAIQFSARTDTDWAAEDALVLVYGGFDSLYRVHIEPGTGKVDDFLLALMNDHAGLFSHVGRLSIGRRASQAMVWRMTASSSSPRRMLQADGLWMRRMRLHVASDWVSAFERELGAGQGMVA